MKTKQLISNLKKEIEKMIFKGQTQDSPPYKNGVTLSVVKKSTVVSQINEGLQMQGGMRGICLAVEVGGVLPLLRK